MGLVWQAWGVQDYT